MLFSLFGAVYGIHNSGMVMPNLNRPVENPLAESIEKLLFLNTVKITMTIYDCVFLTFDLMMKTFSAMSQFISSFIETPPLSTKIPRHAKLVLTDGGAMAGWATQQHKTP